MLRRILPLVLLAFLPSCDAFGPEQGPPANLDPAAFPSGLAVGETVLASVTVTDQEGTALSGTAVTWSPSPGTSVAAVSTSTNGQGVASVTWDLGTTAGEQTLVASADGLEHTFTANVAPGALDRITLDPEAHTFHALGDTVEITAAGEDEFGNAVGIGSLTWASSDPTIASVDNGVIISHARGTADIEAAAGSIHAFAEVLVDQQVAAIAVEPASPVLVVGETVTLKATPLDAQGVPVDTALSLTWTSADEAIATVDETGTVEAVAAGAVRISAVAGAHAADADVDVRSGVRPTITAVQPNVLAAGDTATISGTGFADTPAGNTVTVAGVAATVLTASAGELMVSLPDVGAFPCAPTGDAEVRVEVDDLAAAVDHPVRGATRHALAVGESVALFGADVACGELSEPGDYVIAVSNGAPSPTSITSFRLRGTGSASATLLADRVRPRISVPGRQPELEPRPAEIAHLEMLDENRRLVERLGAPELRDPGMALKMAAVETGDLRTFRIPNIDGSNTCSDYTSVVARAVYAGEYGVIWEDTVAPLAGSMDEAWHSMGVEYDSIMHPILLDYFGDPLVFDDRLDANDRFFMLFSQTVNDFERGVNGFVWSGDFYSRYQCAASDGAEMFYGRVPTSADDGYGDGTLLAWLWGIRSTVIHEVKHVTAYANKFDVSPSSPNYEESGLEESTARLAEEFYGRALQGYARFDNVGYESSIWCERRVGDRYPDCDRVPLIMGKHYGGLNAYLKSPALLSAFGRTGSGDWSFYGSGWQLVRWTLDQSGQSEADFIKALIREPELTGPANLAARAGRSIAALMADYAMALALDDHPTGVATDAALTIPSWDTRDIFSGLHDDYAGTATAATYPTSWPLEPQPLPPAAFNVTTTAIHGGGFAVFTLDGVAGPQLLELLSEAGGSAPASLALSIARVR